MYKKKTFEESLLQPMKYLQKKCGNSCELSIGHQTLLAIAVATGFIIKSHNKQCVLSEARRGGSISNLHNLPYKLWKLESTLL